MAEFVVNTDQLRSNADRIAALQRELDSVAVRLGAMQLGSVLQIKASTALIARVGDCKWAAVNQSDNLGKLARGLDDIALLYDNVEKNLADPKTQAEAQAEAAANAVAAAAAAVGAGGVFGHIADSFKITDLVSWLGRRSLPFSIYSAFDSLFNGGDKAVSNFIKNLSYAVGTTTKAITATAKSGWGDGLKTLFGFSASGTGGLGDSWKKFWDSMNPSGKSTVGKVGVFAKWAGYAMTAVNNFFDNKEEFEGDTSNLRMWGETVVESATDIALAAGASILVAAALPASAPAIVVGAVGAGVVWLGNEVCEYFTGQDIAECVSDAVYGAAEVIGDVASDIGNAVEDAVENVGNAVRETGRNIANAVDSACDWLGGLFG